MKQCVKIKVFIVNYFILHISTYYTIIILLYYIIIIFLFHLFFLKALISSILSVHPLMIPRFVNVFQRLPFAFK